MKLYLIRHGQTDWNIAGKIQGRHDIPLNEKGLFQAHCLAEGMDRRPVERIFSSVQKRAVQTAMAIAERQNKKVSLINGLEEVDFGQWEGLTWEEIERQYPREYRLWSMNPVEVSPPGGENQMDVMRRCAAVMKTVLTETGDTAIVSHGATLAHLIVYLLREQLEEDIIVNNASITTINYNPLTEDFMLLEMNDTSHFDK